MHVMDGKNAISINLLILCCVVFFEQSGMFHPKLQKSKILLCLLPLTTTSNEQFIKTYPAHLSIECLFLGVVGSITHQLVQTN